MTKPLFNLNPAQRKAVEHAGSHLLIIAGPGTGKTHTLTHRIAHFAQDLNPNQKFLAITFTNKAALEMRERIRRHTSDKIGQITIGTFHSFCLQILREFHEDTDLPKNFKVGSVEEIIDVTKTLWPDKTVSQRKAALEEISRWKSIHFREPAPPEVLNYNQHLRQNGLVDFDDLLLEVWKSAEHSIRKWEALHQMYPFIFVDEYQDINPIQHALLKMWVGERGEITAIGDPNQAIYGFRGSDVEFFKTFTADFPGAQIISLADNYRSAANLLTASSQVIEKNNRFTVPPLLSFPQSIRTPNLPLTSSTLSGDLELEKKSSITAQMYLEGQLVVHEAPTDKAEAEYVVHQIERLVGGTSMFSQDSGRVESQRQAERSFGDIAVLYRLNSQRYLLKEALERSGIPYEIAGDKPLEDELLPKADDKYKERTEKVLLMTLHAAKGLEFPVVFIVGCEENLLPLCFEGFETNVEEERRLFYVGMTRAKEQLYLVRANRRLLFGKTCHNAPSSFLSDIEEELKRYEEAQQLRQKNKKEDNQLNLFH